ncbi:hypothetical protein BKA61DRAFT_664269 [Leptodontidium sp. MPI-SDFR-AT-0119]|nr:hypothetical protein BKA61DRAFT_664269 [Leptodontidium sp. MPI-SDFR-AT-0119]
MRHLHPLRMLRYMNHFNESAPEKIPYVMARFHEETLRIYNVLEIRLSGRYTGTPRDYPAGNWKGKYSFADIGTWTYVRSWKFAKFTEHDMASFPHLLRWINPVAEKPAVQRGKSGFYDSEENLES